MNNEENIIMELTELSEEGLIKDFKIIQSDINQVRFLLVTVEGRHLEIETSLNYCYRIKNEKEGILFESFEQILRKFSEGYNVKFGEIIANKLNQLAQRKEEI